MLAGLTPIDVETRYGEGYGYTNAFISGKVLSFERRACDVL